eukprot:4437789-Amphidinium_carterae.1
MHSRCLSLAVKLGGSAQVELVFERRALVSRWSGSMDSQQHQVALHEQTKSPNEMAFQWFGI